MNDNSNTSFSQRAYLYGIVDLLDSDDVRKASEVQRLREERFSSLTTLLNNSKETRDILEILVHERHSVNLEYEFLERNQEIDSKIKETRLAILDNTLVQLRNCIKDAELILKNPKQYTKGIQEAYGQHRTILAPPAGDNVRKFVLAQSQRLGRMNQGFRSTQETSFFVARQEALKTLGFVYTQLQCKALGLDAKKAKHFLGNYL